MFKPWELLKGTVWGMISGPVEAVTSAFKGAFSGGLYAGMLGGALAFVGPFAMALAQGVVPGLENVEWFSKASNFMASSTFTDRLMFLVPAGVGVGAAAGAGLAAVSSVASTIAAPSQTITDPNNKDKKIGVVAYDTGIKLGSTVATVATVVGAGILAAGALKKHGIIGGEETNKPAPPTAKSVKSETNEKVVGS